MKKKVSLITCLMLAAVMLLVFCGCSSFGGIKSAYEKEGYEEAEVSQEIKALYENSEEYKKISEVVKIHVMQKKSTGESVLGDLANKLTVAVIAEFNSNEEMEQALKDHVTDADAKNVYDELQKLETVSGNCLLLFYTPATKGLEIFKNTK